MDWLLDWLSNRTTLPAKGREELVLTDFFEAGWVDSFGIMELIAEIERRFGVVFTAEHFERKSFFNIAGLAKLIAEISEDAP